MGYKEKESCKTGFEQLQTSELEERALQSNIIQTFPSETFQKVPTGVANFMANIIVTFNKQQGTQISCQTGYSQSIMVGIEPVR
jgi:hypothetical protein